MTPEEIDALALAGRVSEVLSIHEEARVEGPAVKRWSFDRLQRAVNWADPGSVEAGLLDRLLELGVATASVEALSATPVPDAVHVPFVCGVDGRGFFRLMHVTPDRVGGYTARANLDAGARAATLDGLRLARERLRHGGMHLHGFLPMNPRGLDGASVHGDSLGAAAFVSALSYFSDRAVIPGTAVTGSVRQGRVTMVGGLEPKVEALAARPDIARLVVPGESLVGARKVAERLGLATEIVGAHSLDDLEHLCLNKDVRRLESPVAAVDAAKADIDRGWQHWQWPYLREQLVRTVEGLPPDALEERVRALTMLGAACRNAGDPDRAAVYLEKAEGLLELEEARWKVKHRWRSYLHRHRAMTEILRGRIDAARAAAQRTIDAAEAGQQRSGYSIGFGVLGLAELAAGNAERAVELQRMAVDALDGEHPERYPRAASQLLAALAEAGDLPAAREVYADVRERHEALGRTERTINESEWLGTFMLEALVRAGEFVEAIELGRDADLRRAIDEVAMPGLLARRWLGIAEVHAGDRAAGYERLGVSSMAYRQELGPHQGFRAGVNVLHECRLRAEFGDLNDETLARLRGALRSLGYCEVVRRELTPLAEELLGLLDSSSAGSNDLALSLQRLIDACDRYR